MKRLALALLAQVAPLCSCATMLAPAHDLVPVDSVPAGAVVVCDGARVGKTPCTVPVPAGVTEFALEADGFHPQVVRPGRDGRDGLLLASFLVWGPIGIIVDGLNGSAVGADTRPICVTLAPIEGPAPAPWVRPKTGWAPIEDRGYPPMDN